MSKRTADTILAGLKEAQGYARGQKAGAKSHKVEVEVVDVRAVRAKLGLSQDEFAKTFGVSLGTVRNWEQGRRMPEGPARVLLQVIDQEPEAVKRAVGFGAA